ncbi:MAG: GNAT family N-acetyltransferase [Saprospiraceae bacterium]|nr:GNAT family N-acetyltransferase [Saprospiraceae bacterium]
MSFFVLIEIIPFSTDNSELIKTLNVEWLSKYFEVEPHDEKVLSNPQEEIIDKGGHIFYTRYKGEIVGTASLLYCDGQSYELSKMAVTADSQGLGAGKALMEYCIAFARDLGATSLFLYSNTKLTRAITMYRKYGFKEQKFDSSIYKRADIKMELQL